MIFDKSPDPEEVRLARKAGGLTQTEAGALVHVSCRAWQKWEAPIGKDNCRIPLSAWELFNAKIGNVKIKVYLR